MKRLKIILQSKIFFLISLLFIILYVIFLTKVVNYSSKYSPDVTTLAGKIVEYSLDGDKLSILLKSNQKEKVQVTYYLSSLEEKEALNDSLKIGEQVTLEGTFSEPLNNTIPNTFNYKEYLYNHHIYYLFTASKIKIDNEVSWLNKIKNAFYEHVKKLDTSSYLQAFILGNTNAIDNDAYADYQTNGVTHLFAISGMHISILINLLNRVLKRSKKKDILIILFLLFYVFVVGFKASVIRASLFYIFSCLNEKSNLHLEKSVILYLTLLMLLIINPFYVYDLGFIYSFATSFGLILFQKKIKGNYFSKLFQVSLIAFIFSLPITLLNSYEFNMLTILNNILIVPLVSLIIFPLSLITFVLPFVEPLLSLSINLLEIINSLLSKISLNIIVPKISIIFIMFYYIGIYLIYKYGFKNIIILIILISIQKTKPYFDSYNYVYYLDVGQGDSAVIVSPNLKEVIMIDTGGKITYEKASWQKRNKEFDLSNNMATFLKSLGIKKIDLLICSHGDIDHIGYADSLSDKIKIARVMFNKNSKNSEEERLSKKIKEVQTYKSKNIQMQNLNDGLSTDENASSLVIYMKIDNYAFLFMGDAPKNQELEIINKYNLTVDVLKLGHHGSKTSSDYAFLENLKPKYSIISSGRNNRYNHPSEETINNLNNLHLKYYNTQDVGTISLKFKNKKFKMTFCSP